MDPVVVPSLPEVIVQKIIKMIGDGIWKPGDCLPSQRQLARELNVGMSSLREALQTLQGMGVLCLRQGQGTFVCYEPSAIVEQCLNLALVLDHDMLQDFMDARRAVESGMAYLAAKRATDEQIARLTEMAEGMRAAVGTGDEAHLKDEDIAFHRLIAEMSDSSILQYLSSALFETLVEFIKVVPHTPQGVERHVSVAKAIRERDPIQSEQAMHLLVDATATYIYFLQSNGD
jgi:GntR family transcriptional repressor for pyruvate dehydrogenase complex